MKYLKLTNKNGNVEYINLSSAIVVVVDKEGTKLIVEWDDKTYREYNLELYVKKEVVMNALNDIFNVGYDGIMEYLLDRKKQLRNRIETERFLNDEIKEKVTDYNNSRLDELDSIIAELTHKISKK